MTRTSLLAWAVALLALVASAAKSPPPPPPDGPPRLPVLPMPESDPDLPWEADWDFRRDTTLDGKVGDGAGEYRLRLYDCGQGWNGRTFWKERAEFDLTAEVVRPANGGTVVLLRTQDVAACTVYLGSRGKDGVYAGTWHDHRGGSGDWDMRLRKEVTPLGVHGVTSTATYDPDAAGMIPPPAPLAGPTPARGFVIAAEDGKGKVVKQTTSGDRGRYQLSLPPGKYTITFTSPDPERLPHCHPPKLTVEVKDGSSHRTDCEANNLRR